MESQRFGDTRSGSVGASRTFAEVEADLLRTIRHATVGGTVLEMTGRRLGGTEDRLSAYHGRVVLLNFWATWCVPCIDVLPELRELVAELPADRFALLGISVDEELETVTAFREREPMPWTNWHVGIDSDLARAWGRSRVSDLRARRRPGRDSGPRQRHRRSVLPFPARRSGRGHCPVIAPGAPAGTSSRSEKMSQTF